MFHDEITVHSRMTKKPPFIITTGGKNVNFLVRSRATGLQNLNHTCKNRLNANQSSRLAALTRLELLQNAQVQKSLKDAMAQLKKEESVFNATESKLRYVEKLKVEQCHRRVCRIRKLSDNETQKLSLNNDETRKNTLYKNKTLNAVKNTGPRKDDGTLSHKQKEQICQTLPGFHISPKYTKGAQTEKVCSSAASSRENISIPKLQSESQHDPVCPLKSKKNTNTNFSLPPLGADSKFKIMRRTFELRTQRKAKLLNKPTPWSTFCTEKDLQKKSEEPFNKKYEKLEIFANNLDVLKQKTLPEEQKSDSLPQLTNLIQFTDYDDYLHMRNRLDKLSPIPAVQSYSLSKFLKE